eukprot:SAG31_NODE_5129_length_2724_cov_2.380571_3_plen_323_part_00
MAGGLASRYGRRRILTIGVTLVSASTVLFGVASAVLAARSVPTLAMMMAVLRVAQGGGAALATTCIFAILTDSFPKNKGSVIGAANACDGAGWAIGPPLGGFLYVVGGFQLPFYVVGPLPLVLLLGQLLFYPSPTVVGGKEEEETAPIGLAEALSRARVLLRIKRLLLTAAAGVVFTSKWGMVDIAFTRWCIAEFGFSVATASVYFSIPAMAFLFIAPIGGLVVDQITRKASSRVDSQIAILMLHLRCCLFFVAAIDCSWLGLHGIFWLWHDAVAASCLLGDRETPLACCLLGLRRSTLTSDHAGNAAGHAGFGCKQRNHSS